jgi:hypothetical protein
MIIMNSIDKCFEKFEDLFYRENTGQEEWIECPYSEWSKLKSEIQEIFDKSVQTLNKHNNDLFAELLDANKRSLEKDKEIESLEESIFWNKGTIHKQENEKKELKKEIERLKTEIIGYKGTLEIYENPNLKKSLDKALKQKEFIGFDIENTPLMKSTKIALILEENSQLKQELSHYNTYSSNHYNDLRKKIEDIKDKHIIAFAILHHVHLPKSLCLVIESEVLEELKNLLESEKEDLQRKVQDANSDENSKDVNLASNPSENNERRKVSRIWLVKGKKRSKEDDK